MMGLNLKQAFVAAAVAFFLTGVWQVLFSFGLEKADGDEQNLSAASMTPQLGEYRPADNSDLFIRYERLQPSEKQPETEVIVENQAPEKPVVDKTLRPNFLNFDSEHQVGLVSVVKQPEKFAVLQLIHFASGEINFKKVSVGQQYGPYRIEEISDLSVLLKNETSELRLALFNAKKTV